MTEVKEAMKEVLADYMDENYKNELELTHNKIVEIELFVFGSAGFSVSSFGHSTIVDFYLLYF